MRKLIAAFKVSLDGKTEGPDGRADWASAWSEDYGLTSRIDACIMGGGMYRGYEQYWTGIRREPDKVAWISGQPPTERELEWSRLSAEIPHYVLSATQSGAGWPNVRFLRRLDEVAGLKQQPGGDIYLMGGARVAASMLEVGLIDELRLIVHPLLAGEGSTLFDPKTGRQGLELLDAKALPKGLVSLVYSVNSRTPAQA